MKTIKILGLASLLTAFLFLQTNVISAASSDAVTEPKSDRRIDYDNDEYWKNHMKNRDEITEKKRQDHHKSMRSRHRDSSDRRHCHSDKR